MNVMDGWLMFVRLQAWRKACPTSNRPQPIVPFPPAPSHHLPPLALALALAAALDVHVATVSLGLSFDSSSRASPKAASPTDLHDPSIPTEPTLQPTNLIRSIRLSRTVHVRTYLSACAGQLLPALFSSPASPMLPRLGPSPMVPSPLPPRRPRMSHRRMYTGQRASSRCLDMHWRIDWQQPTDSVFAVLPTRSVSKAP